MQSARAHVILIDGVSGAGKTTLANTMATMLDATVVHLDDVYPGWDGLVEGRDRVIESVLVPFVTGGNPRLPLWNWERGEAGDTIRVPPSDVLIVEGCGISTARSRRFADTVVWMSCPDDVRRTRLRERDGDAFDPFVDLWDRQVADHIANDDPIDTATVRLNG